MTYSSVRNEVDNALRPYVPMVIAYFNFSATPVEREVWTQVQTMVGQPSRIAIMRDLGIEER